MNVIRLFNPNSKPFGRLSNNSKHKMIIDGEEYNTVTNYVLSNMLSTPLHKKIIQNTEIKGGKGDTTLLDAIQFLRDHQNAQASDVEDFLQDSFDPNIDKLVQDAEKGPYFNRSDWQKLKKLRELKKDFEEKKDFEKAKEVEQKIKSFKPKNGYKINIFAGKTKNQLEGQRRDYEQARNQLQETTKKRVEELCQKDPELSEVIQKRAQQQLQTLNRLIERVKFEIKLINKRKYIENKASQKQVPFHQINLEELEEKTRKELEIQKMGIYGLFNRYLDQEILETIRESLQKGYETLLKDNDKFAEVLRNTGNAPILFQDVDPYLGVGTQGENGHNLVGRVLMQIRQSMNKEKEIEKKRSKDQKQIDKIYDIYVAYMLLEDAMKKGNNLSTFQSKNIPQIINHYYKVFKNEEEVFGPGKDAVMKLYVKEQLPVAVCSELNNAGTLVMNIRKIRLRELRNRLLNKQKDIIFNRYLEYMANRNFEEKIDEMVEARLKQREQEQMPLKELPEIYRQQIRQEIIEKAVNQQLKNQSMEQIEEMKSRIVDLFKLGMLSDSLSTKIDHEIDDLNIPSEEEVKLAEQAEVSLKSCRSTSLDISDLEIEEDNGDRSDSSSSSSDDEEEVADKVTLEKLFDFKDVQPGVDVKEGADQEPILLYPDVQDNDYKVNKLTPRYVFQTTFDINGFSYPSVQHYVFTKILAMKGHRVVDLQEIRKVQTVITHGEKTKVPKTGTEIPFKTAIFTTQQQYEDFGTRYVKGMGLRSAYQYIVMPGATNLGNIESFKDFNSIVTECEAFEYKSHQQLLTHFALTAINKKFQDRNLQDLLALTGNAKLVYDDNNDWVLGTGEQPTIRCGYTTKPPVTKRGKNMVGVILMTLRATVAKLRESEEQILLQQYEQKKADPNLIQVPERKYEVTRQDIIEFTQEADPQQITNPVIEEKELDVFEGKRTEEEGNMLRIRAVHYPYNDSIGSLFVQDWTKSRLKDMCKNVSRVYDNLKKLEPGLVYSADFVKIVLNSIFNCMPGGLEMSRFEVPDYFIGYMNTCPIMHKNQSQIQKWNRELKELKEKTQYVEPKFIPPRMKYEDVGLFEEGVGEDDIFGVFEESGVVVPERKKDLAKHMEEKRELWSNFKKYHGFNPKTSTEISEHVSKKKKLVSDFVDKYLPQQKSKTVTAFSLFKEDPVVQQFVGTKLTDDTRNKNLRKLWNNLDKDCSEIKGKGKAKLAKKVGELQELLGKNKSYFEEQAREESGVGMTHEKYISKLVKYDPKLFSENRRNVMQRGEGKVKFPEKEKQELDLLSRQLDNMDREFWGPQKSPEEKKEQLKEFEKKVDSFEKEFMAKDERIYGKREDQKLLEGKAYDQLVEEVNRKYSKTILTPGQIESIAQVYWNSIVSIIMALIKELGLPDMKQGDVRVRKKWKEATKLLLDYQNILSEPKVCTTYVDEEELNCTVSAIINLLQNIQNVKENVLSPDVPKIMDKDDVDLATSIIIDSKVNWNRVQSKELKVDRILEALHKITVNMDHDRVAEDVVKCAYYISNYKMSKSIKENRINFFATYEKNKRPVKIEKEGSLLEHFRDMGMEDGGEPEEEQIRRFKMLSVRES